MAKNKHPLAIFGGNTTKGTGFSGREWDISLIDQGRDICEPEADRHIIYGVKTHYTNYVEARIREARKGTKLELLIFVWSDEAVDDTHGIKVIHEDVPVDDLETLAQRRAYLKCVASVVETLAKRMKSLDDAIKKGWTKIIEF